MTMLRRSLYFGLGIMFGGILCAALYMIVLLVLVFIVP